jgi:hypothetical protein
LFRAEVAIHKVRAVLAQVVHTARKQTVTRVVVPTKAISFHVQVTLVVVLLKVRVALVKIVQL